MEHLPDYELCMLSKAQAHIAELEKKLAITVDALEAVISWCDITGECEKPSRYASNALAALEEKL